MAALKKHYDALGSYLHLPTIKQFQTAVPIDTTRLRKRCEELAAQLDAVLSSPIFNVTLGAFARFECFRCQRQIRKRLSREADQISAECFECGATYAVTTLAADDLEIRPKRQEVKCAGGGCTGTTNLWESDLQAGKFWKCDMCHGRNVLVLGFIHEPGAG